MNRKPPDARPLDDIRMRGFTRRSRVADVWTWLRDQVAIGRPETVALPEAAGRVLAEDVISSVDVPSFSRAMMDGYAVRASDTSGASTYNRLKMVVIGESLPGRGVAQAIAAGQAIRIMTGAPLPQGADAVLPAEYAQLEADHVWSFTPISPGKHVARPGEDISAEDCVLQAGRVLRPQDVGVLASIGRGEVSVVRAPRVRIVITGNELLPVGCKPHGCQIVDSNGVMLTALVRRDGGIVDNPGIIPDDPDAIRQAILADADVVLVSGGSSVGQEDHAPRMVAEQGELAIHGVAMRPSSPAGLGRVGHRLVFLLPGNPVSCLCAYDCFAGRAIRSMGGRSWEWPYRVVRRKLARKLGSAIGRVDFARVRIVDHQVHPLSIGGASILSSATRADGFTVVPEDSEGYAANQEVDVFLYDL